MADARVTTLAGEVLGFIPPPSARASLLAGEVLANIAVPASVVTTLAGEVLAMIPTGVAAVTSLQGEVLSINPPLNTWVTAVNAEVLATIPSTEGMSITELHAEAIVANTGDDTGVRSAQLAVEVLSLSDDYVRSAQLVAEVLLRPLVLPCTTTPVAYRLRVRNAADDGDDLSVTSLLTGADAVIADVPTIDGATFDPLSGRVTIGNAMVRVIDAAAGFPDTTPDLTDRIVTKVLADANAESQLLGRKAYLERATDFAAPDWVAHFGGYVTSLALVDAITWEIGVAHTSRDDATSKAWATHDNVYLDARSYMLGGPVSAAVPYDHDRTRKSSFQGYWKATVQAVFDTFIHVDINEDTSAAFPPADLRDALKDRGWIRVSNNDAQRNVFRWANGEFRKYFVRDYPSDAARIEWLSEVAHANAIRGYAPRVLVQVISVNAGFVNHRFPLMASYERATNLPGGAVIVTDDSLMCSDLGNYSFWNWTNADAVAQPSVGDVVTFYAQPMDTSPTAPVWVVRHPADILSDLMLAQGYTVDAGSVTDAKADSGEFLLALRVTDPPTIQDAVAMIGGAFGIGVRTNPDGSKFLFCWRTRRTPVATVTLDALANAPASWWNSEEPSKVFSVAWQFVRFDTWPGTDQSAQGNDRGLDGIAVFEERPIVFQTGNVQPAQSRTQTYDIRGCLLHTDGSPLTALTDFVAPAAAVILETFGNGAIEFPLDVLPEIAADIGDELYVQVEAIPGFDAGETPVAQRGLLNRCLVVGRTPFPWGDRLKLLRIPETGETPSLELPDPGAITELDDGVTLSVGSPATSVVRLTLDDATNWADSGASIEIEYAVQASEPTADGIPWPPVWMAADSSTFDLTGFAPGVTVWVRHRTRIGSLAAFGPWSAWDSITLDSTTSTPPTGMVQPPLVTATVDGVTGEVDVDVVAGPEAVTVYAVVSTSGYPNEAAIVAGTPDSTLAFHWDALGTITPSQVAYVGALVVDLLGNRSVPGLFAIGWPTLKAPANAEFLTLALNAELSNERQFNPSDRFDATDNGANDTYDLDLTTNIRDVTLAVVFDGAGSPVATGTEVDVPVDIDGHIIAWRLLADATGDVLVDVYKDVFANFPPTLADRIPDTGTPTMTSDDHATGDTASWSATAVAPGDVLRFHVDTATAATRITIALTIRRD